MQQNLGVSTSNLGGVPLRSTAGTEGIDEEEKKVDWIVDCEVCRLERKAEKQRWLRAKIREALVILAYLDLRTIMAMLEIVTEPSSHAFLFEILFYFAFQKWLNGKSLQEAGFVPSDATSSPFLRESCNIPLEFIGNSLLRLPDAPDGSGIKLQSQFLNCHCLDLESETTILRNQGSSNTLQERHVMVALTEKRVLVFLIQCKLEQNTDYLKAVQQCSLVRCCINQK